MSDIAERKSLKERPDIDRTIKPPVRVPPKTARKPIVRWLQWGAVGVFAGVAIVAAIMLTRGGQELDSTLVPMGARYTNPDFDPGFRFIAPSGPTLDQMEELTTSPLVPMGARYTDPEFDVGFRFIGENGLTLEEFESVMRLASMDVLIDQARWETILASLEANSG